MMPTYNVKQRPDGVWRVRWRDDAGKESSKHFRLKRDAEAHGAAQVAALQAGTYIDPRRAKTTVADWCDTWIVGYAKHRDSTVKQARVHLAVIKSDLGSRLLRSIRPSDVKAWVVELQTRGLAPSYVYALHARLAQVFTDAVHDGLVSKSPCSRRTSPAAAKQRAYVATTDQVWALHDSIDRGFRPAILLGAFAGLRVAEAVALRVEDVDFMRGVVTPAIQYPDLPLKTEMSKTPIPIPPELAVMLNANVVEWGSGTIVVGTFGRAVTPYRMEEAFRQARAKVDGLPDGFRYHDLRHYFASLLIAAGLDIKTVQARLRHASAKTTLDTYGHLWPDKDESSRAAVAAALVRPLPKEMDITA
ncbi:tyrosine-type recombinase/integrase [Microbacterium gorillae]|uniref:tyrosine-type recombinase/integrase n=1 Tax=Microbacterium gorillae TaxID=1231063 RepID=UPI000B171849|nr:site-specific integrase [Microbacterium gorillae]